MKKSTVVIALLAVLAIVFGILFITGNNEKNDLKAKVDELNSVVAKAADQGKIDLDSAVAAAKQEAEEATNKAVEDAVAAAKAEAESANQKAVEDAVAAAKAEGETALADAKAAGEKAVEEAKAAGEKAVEEAKAAGEKAVEETKAAGEKALADAKAEADKALKAVQDELETWKTKAGDLEAQIAAAATAATEKVEEVKEAATEKVEEVKDAATEKVEEVKDAASEKVEEAKEAATGAVEEAKEAATEKVEEVKEAAEEVKDAATETVTQAAETVEEKVEEAAAEITVMDHAAYAAAELDTEVVIETTVQATQAWWEKDGIGKITVYGQSEDGAYFIYEMNCSKEDAEKLVPGTKIRVKGFKSAWSGEVEITDATFEFVEGEGFKAEPEDVTALLGTEELINKQNALVAFKGLTVAAKKDAEGNDAAFLYKWNGAGQQGDDLYFDVTVNGATYTFVVESYLCGQDTEVYKAVEGLKVGDVIDVEGFLYWYEGVQPHIIKVTAAQ
jgi:hypothetical protein